MTQNRIDKIKSIIEDAGSSYVSVTFVKKDGSERQLTFNPADHNDVKGTGNTENIDPNIFRVRDNAKKAWRSFDARRVLKIKSKGTTTNFGEDQ